MRAFFSRAYYTATLLFYFVATIILGILALPVCFAIDAFRRKRI